MADVRVGGAVIDFVARNAAFLRATRANGAAILRNQRAVRALRGTIQRFNRSAEDMLRRFTSLRNIAVGLAGAGGFGLLVRNTINHTSALRENAQQAGINVRSFQELSFIAQNYAVSQDALIDGLKELSLRTDEYVATGVGPAAEAIQRLGFTTDELVEGLQDTDRLFEEVIRRTQQLDSAAQIRIADELFGGTGGEQFVRIIQGGVESIARLRMEAQSLGLIIPEDQILQAERLRQRFGRLEYTLRTRLATAILENADAMEDMVGRIEGLIPKALDLATVLVRGFGFLVDNARTIIQVLAATRAAAASFSVGRLFGPIGGLVGAAAGGAAGFFGAGALLDQLDSAAPLRDLGDLPGTGGTGGAGGRRLLATPREIEQETRDIRNFFQSFVANQQLALTRSASQLANLGDTDREAFLFNAQLERSLAIEQRRAQIQEQIERGTLGAQEAMAELNMLAGDEGLLGEFNFFVNSVFEANQNLEITRQRLEEISRVSTALGDSIAGAVDRFLAGAQSLSQTLRSLLTDVTAIFRQELIINPLRGFLQRSIAGGLIGQAQEGGIHRGLTLVGERGPELVDFRQTARVYDADQTRQILGGGREITFAPVIQSANADEIRAVYQEEIFPQEVALIESIVQEQMRRAG